MGEALSNVLIWTIYTIGGGVLLCLVALFVGICYMIISGCVQTMRGGDE